jgi:tRNA pseudouridine13 synthase
MKLKQQPEDFQVEERTDVVPDPSGRGDFALYRLEKRGWTTPDALGVLRRRWKVDHRRMSYGGLKDRHALTVQYLSILRGPQRNLNQQGIVATYLGQIPRPYSSQDIRANRFQITLRNLTPDKAEQAQIALDEVRRQGIPNYFDDQRFGSVVSDGPEFIARLIVLGRHEEALRLALAAPYQFDRAPQKAEKATLLAHWGDWATCKDRLPRGHIRSLVDYLRVHPTDFRGALEQLKPELRSLYLSAYQSHLWNRTLALSLRYIAAPSFSLHPPSTQSPCEDSGDLFRGAPDGGRLVRPEQLLSVRLRLGNFPFHRNLDDTQIAALAVLSLPLPSARWKPEPDDPRAPLVREVLKEDGLELEGMKLRGFKEMFFSKGERPALCRPANLEGTVETDDLRPGKTKLILSFELPRGSYATLVVKRLMGTATEEGTADERG